MMLEVKSAVKNCKQCLHHDSDSMRALLVPIEATGPMDLLHLDFTKIEVSGDHEKELKKKPEVVNVLVVTDHFTQHTMAFVTEDATTHTVARVETRGCCPLEDRQLHRKKKDQEQVELRELYSPASTRPRYSNLRDTG